MASVPESLSLRVGLQADLMLARKTTSNTKSPKKFEPPKLADSCCVVGASSPHPSCSASSSIHGAVHTLAERPSRSGRKAELSEIGASSPHPSCSASSSIHGAVHTGVLGCRNENFACSRSVRRGADEKRNSPKNHENHMLTYGPSVQYSKSVPTYRQDYSSTL